MPSQSSTVPQSGAFPPWSQCGGTQRCSSPSPLGEGGAPEAPSLLPCRFKSRLCVFHVEIFSFSPFIPPFFPCPDYGASTGSDGDECPSGAHSGTGRHRGDRSDPRVPPQLRAPRFFLSPSFPLRSSLLPAGTGNTRVDVIGSGSPGREAQPSLPLLRPRVLWLCVGMRGCGVMGMLPSSPALHTTRLGAHNPTAGLPPSAVLRPPLDSNSPYLGVPHGSLPPPQARRSTEQGQQLRHVIHETTLWHWGHHPHLLHWGTQDPTPHPPVGWPCARPQAGPWATSGGSDTAAWGGQHPLDGASSPRLGGDSHPLGVPLVPFSSLLPLPV